MIPEKSDQIASRKRKGSKGGRPPGFDALATHHRIAASDAKGARFGLPEVSLGLLPGGGGVTRTVRMLGLQKALADVILPATKFTAEAALAVGIVDEVAPTAEIRDRAKAWIAANPAPVKPWDVKGFRLPGGGPSSPTVASMLGAMPALLRKQTKGAPLPAPRAAMAAAVEGSYVDFDTASTIESRYLVHLTHSQVTKNMIKAFFFDLQSINSGASRPVGYPTYRAKRLGVVGAGMMGAAIAYVAARSGIDVVLKDVSREASEKGKDYSRRLEEKALKRGQTSQERSDELLDRIATTGDAADFAGVDFVIEAVFESVPVKQAVFKEIQDVVLPDAVLGSNTSTLPISLLAEAVADWMVEEQDRPGRKAGRGFYDYDETGRRIGVWQGVRDKYASGTVDVPVRDLQERMLFAEALDTIDCLDNYVLTSVADANIGSIYGIGFPAWTGGVLQYVNQYEGGLTGFVARANELADRYGERFRPPASLVKRASVGEIYE